MTELLDLARHVRTQAGVRRYHKPIGSLISGRDVAKAIVAAKGLDGVLAGHNSKGTGTSKGTLDDPINCAGNVVLAAKLLAEGKHIRLNHEAEVGTLLDRLAFLTQEAAKKGKDAPDIDLCRVSVPKTNLFCAQTKGIPRAQMPQLSGVPLPGSKADALPKVRGGEVDITTQFQAALRARGVKVTATSMPADHLKATQNQLIGPKVAGIYEAMKDAPANSGLFERIMVTRDGYVIDGHHRWAAQVALETTRGTDPKKMKMRVEVVDMDIGEALDASNAFAADWGIPQQGFVLNTPAVPGAPDHLDEPPPVKDPNPSTVHLNYTEMSLDKGVDLVGKAYGWKDRDKAGGGDKADIVQQDKAQILAKVWYESDSGASAKEAKAKELWASYQSKTDYTSIQKALREGTVDKKFLDGTSAEEIRSLVSEMFEKGGYTTTAPMKVYRALKSDTGSMDMPHGQMTPLSARHLKAPSPDWAQKLTPGTVFTDKGIVSTTAHEKFSRGWLMNTPAGDTWRTPKPDDVVMEIRVPAGQRVVGGDPQFIETMLPPGTRLRVISSAPATDKAVDPLDGDQKAKITYTRVVAEVVPDGS